MAKEAELKTEPGRYRYGNGLWLQVRSARRRSWLYRYKFAGRDRQMGLGSVDKVSIGQALVAVETWGAVLGEGRDPIEVRRAPKKPAAPKPVVTFKQAAERYIDDHAPAWRSPKSPAQWRATLKRYAYDRLGAMPIETIVTADVLAVLEPIWKTKTETASRLRGRIERVMGAALVRGGWEQPNPARWRDNLKEPLAAPATLREVEHFPALPWPEAPAFLPQLRSVDGHPARALELQILTASRPGPVRVARRHEINLEARMWSIPKGHMKDRKPFRIPLSDAAMALLAAQLDQLGSPDDLLFPGQRPGQPLSGNTLEDLVKCLCGGNPRYRDRESGRLPVPHGFRSTFFDWAVDSTDYPLAIIEAALAHKAGDKGLSRNN